jgi:hypothetical protein
MKQKLLTIVISLFILALTCTAYAIPYTDADYELNGSDYSLSTGTWYDTAEGETWTAWANMSVTYEYDLEAGNWNIGLNVVNHGYLGTGWYWAFQVDNGQGETLYIAASDTEINSGFFNVDLTDGLYSVTYTWINDKYAPSLSQDANILISNVFFDNTATAAPVPEPGTFLLLGSGLVGLALYRRKRK